MSLKMSGLGKFIKVSQADIAIDSVPDAEYVERYMKNTQ